ncbi:MAG: DDE-type integrase/transposase/recombinase [Paludibacteraceae bacterium]|nr:DDE-type integrase/transposase/recombinase [Paludibacteraceae bacterium]
MTVKDICKVFGATKQAYYKRDLSQLQTRLLQEQIAIDYALSIRQSDPGIGARKLYAMYCKESACEGKPLSRDHFSRLLKERQMMLRVHRSKVPKTTDSRHHLPLYPNKVLDVIPIHANQIWVSDITYIKVWDDKPTDQFHFCYLALITDAYSKMVKDYAVGGSLETIHPLSALQMALSSQPQDFDVSGLTHHSDRGVQYASAQYVQLLKKHNITISMTEDGNPKHNAIASASTTL